MVTDLRDSPIRIPPEQRTGDLWKKIKKPCTLRDDIKDTKAWAKLAWDEHNQSQAGEYGRITLVVANTVKTACELRTELDTLAKPKKGGSPSSIEIRLVHSRFRPHERALWRDAFLNRDACNPKADRIVVATQVVEAGVDISATALITELAPWPSLVQRFGRAARYSGTASIVVVDRKIKDDKAAAPYSKAELDAATVVLHQLPDATIAGLELFEEQHPELLSSLYPYEPKHLLLRRELDELFDTTPDLTGADLDISRFIRSGDERDVLVFWHDIPIKQSPADDLQPRREELCPVPFLDAKEKWLFDKKSAKPNVRAWVWDYLDGIWRTCRKDDIYPGQTILVEQVAGGYDSVTGWTGRKQDHPDVIRITSQDSISDLVDNAQDRENQCQDVWKTILTHGQEAEVAVRRLAVALKLPEPLPCVLGLEARWHDVGKAHAAFAGCIRHDVSGCPPRNDLAKAPPKAWVAKSEMYCLTGGNERRPGFRHELATALAVLAVLERHNPLHPALLGPYQELFEKLGKAIPSTPADSAPTVAERELLTLDATAFNLLLYLACAHHGKVRGALHAAPADQDYRDRHDGQGMPIRGVRAGDRLPAIAFADSAGTPCMLPVAELHLEVAAMGLSSRTGPSWTERVTGLFAIHGPFSLAYLETLVRVADIRASRLGTPDPLLTNGGAV